MNRQFILTLYILISSLALFAQEKKVIRIPDTIRAFRFATVYETEEDFNTKELKTELIAVYGFDNRKNCIHAFDETGLYFTNEYDSLNNLVAEYFYEGIDSSEKKRTLSGKWIYGYSNGLCDKIDRYFFIDGKWVFEETVRNSYLLDKSGRIIEENHFDNENQLKSKITYSYSPNQVKKTEKLDFNRGWFTNHSCSKEVVWDASDNSTIIKNHEYDENGNLIRSISENLSEKKVKTMTRVDYNYSSTGFLMEETVYMSDDGKNENEFSVKNFFEYDEQGFVTKYTSKRPNNSGSVKVYDYLDK